MPGATLEPATVRDHEPAPDRYRPAYFKEAGVIEKTPVFQSTALAPGTNIVGPAIIEEPLTTLVLCPGSCVQVSAHRNYEIELD